MIAQESERLSRVAADILLANRIDSGRLQLETTPLDVARLAEDVVEQMRSCFAERDDVTLELVAAEPGSFVAGDEDKLRQVLINLVDNAVKYSPDGGAVEIRVEPERTTLRRLGLATRAWASRTASSSGSSASSTGSILSSRAASAAPGSASTSAASSSAGWTVG